MQEIDKALSDIAHIRQQLASNSRFQGFTPPIIALTGLLGIGLAAWQSSRPELTNGVTSYFAHWILLAVICGLLTATDAVIRARIVHRDMADMMLATTLRQFVPAGLVGAFFGVFVIIRVPEAAWLLPGLWQMLVALAIFTALSNLPTRTIWVVAFYFLAGLVSLVLAETSSLSPWLMGVPFGVGQMLAAWILFTAAQRGRDG